MSNLNDAIQLIRQGRKDEARPILESLLKMEPGNIQVWFWYVDICSTLEKRIQTLETCLKLNPGNSQVTQALLMLRNQRSPKESFTPPPAQSPKLEESKPLQTPSPYSSMYDEESESPAYSSNTPINFDAVPVEKSARLQQAQGKQKQAWDEDFSSYVDSSMLSKPTPAAKSYGFFDAWVTVLTSTDIESYESVLNDPEAGAGRAFEWIAYAGIISGLIFPFSLISNPQFKELINMPEFNGLFGGMSMAMLFMTLALAMALLTPISSLIGLAIGAGIQNMLAVLFGGRGYYGRTVYALAAYLAPMTILVALLGAIPLVGQCLTSLVGFYNIFLNVRAIRAAHSLSVGQALGVMFAPGILLIILACLIVFVIGSSGISN